MRVVAIIPAAGKGLRIGGAVQKQFLTLHGLPLIVHTLLVFEGLRVISDIIVVVPSEEEYHIKSLIEEYRLKKIAKVVHGGKTRQDSVYAGLLETETATDLVVVHDGVRPLVTEEVILQTIFRAKELGGAIAAIPVSDTLKEASLDGCISRTWNRYGFWLAQTPQAFRREILLAACQRAQKENLVGTDEASLVERLGYPIGIVEGSRENIKVTTPEDLKIVGFLLSKRRESEKPYRTPESK